jgi:hypothetical protein
VITVYWFEIDMTRIERLREMQNQLDRDSGPNVQLVTAALRELIEMMIQDELRMKTLFQATGTETGTAVTGTGTGTAGGAI